MRLSSNYFTLGLAGLHYKNVDQRPLWVCTHHERNIVAPVACTKHVLISCQKIIAEKPKQEERINQTISRGKDLQDNEYLTPEQKEHITRESKDIEVNWNDFTNQLDDAKTRYSRPCYSILAAAQALLNAVWLLMTYNWYISTIELTHSCFFLFFLVLSLVKRTCKILHSITWSTTSLSRGLQPIRSDFRMWKMMTAKIERVLKNNEWFLR